MKKRLTHVSPLPLGITLAVLYGLMALIVMVPLFLFATVAGAVSARSGHAAFPAIFSGVFILFLPVIYALMGFIGGVIAAAIYNLVAKWTGGVEFTAEDVQ